MHLYVTTCVALVARLWTHLWFGVESLMFMIEGLGIGFFSLWRCGSSGIWSDYLSSYGLSSRMQSLTWTPDSGYATAEAVCEE